MKFEIENNHVIIKQIPGDNESLSFNFKYYLKGNTNIGNQIYGPLNRFLADQPEEFNDKLFNVYKKIHRIFYKDRGNVEIKYPEEDIHSIVEILKDRVSDLYKNINHSVLAEWCEKKGNFYYQPNLKEDYGQYRPETTYLKEHYKGLLFLSTLLKFITPIWGVFVSEFDKAIGKDYKETIALSLLSKTYIFTLPEFEKLEELVVFISDKTVITINAVFGNLGTIDLPDWTLATVTVKKLAVAEVDNEKVKLINIIYSHLTNLNKKNSLEDRGDSIRIRERKTPEEDSSRDEENRSSVLEKYKLRQIHPDHISIIDEVYLYDIKRVIKDIDPTFPFSDEPYKSYITSFKKINLSTLEICDFHLQICGVVCEKVIAPWNLENIQYSEMIKVLFISQLLLHYWGFEILSNLLIAKIEEIPDDVLKDTSYVSLSPKLQESISKLYPHYKNNTKTMTINRKQLLLNYGTIFINNTAEFINKYNWYYTNDFLSDKKNSTGTIINVPVKIKDILANLLLKTLGDDTDNVKN